MTDLETKLRELIDSYQELKAVIADQHMTLSDQNKQIEKLKITIEAFQRDHTKWVEKSKKWDQSHLDRNKMKERLQTILERLDHLEAQLEHEQKPR